MLGQRKREIGQGRDRATDTDVWRELPDLLRSDIDVLAVDFVFEDRRNFDHGRESKGIADVFS
jgi:hypothetical protein